MCLEWGGADTNIFPIVILAQGKLDRKDRKNYFPFTKLTRENKKKDSKESRNGLILSSISNDEEDNRSAICIQRQEKKPVFNISVVMV